MAVVQGISGRVKRYVSVTARMDEDAIRKVIAETLAELG